MHFKWAERNMAYFHSISFVFDKNSTSITDKWADGATDWYFIKQHPSPTMTKCHTNLCHRPSIHLRTDWWDAFRWFSLASRRSVCRLRQLPLSSASRAASSSTHSGGLCRSSLSQPKNTKFWKVNVFINTFLRIIPFLAFSAWSM